MEVKRKAIVYCRVSSKEQEDTGFSLDSQEELLTSYAESKGYTTVKVYKVAESASKWQIRKTLGEMLVYAEKQKINLILVEKIDRLTRNLRDAVTMDEWVRKDGQREVHFVKEGFVLNENTRAHEHLIWNMKVSIARFYTDNLSEEVKKGQAEKLRQGGYPSRAPLGYQTIGDRGRKEHVPDPNKASFIKKAFECYATGQYSLGALRDKLYQDGLRTHDGVKLGKSRLAEILGDPFYYGAMRWKDIVYKAKHQGLVPREIFDQVQTMLANRTAPHYKRHVFLFTKMMSCGECGGTISGEVQKGHIYYSCKHGRVCKQKGTTREEKVENQLMGVFELLGTLTSSEVEHVRTQLLADHEVEAQYQQNSIDRLQKRYNLLERQIGTIYEDRLNEHITVEEWKKRDKAMREEQEQISTEIARLQSGYTNYRALYSGLLELGSRSASIYLKQKNPERRRQLMTLLFSNLTLKPQKVLPNLVEVISKLEKRLIARQVSLEEFEPQKTLTKKGQNIPSSLQTDTLLRDQDSNLEPTP